MAMAENFNTGQEVCLHSFRQAQRFFPGWSATLIDLPADVLVSEAKSREIEGLWLREPQQFLHDALPRARAFLDRFGDVRGAIVDLRSGPAISARRRSVPGFTPASSADARIALFRVSDYPPARPASNRIIPC